MVGREGINIDTDILLSPDQHGHTQCVSMLSTSVSMQTTLVVFKCITYKTDVNDITDLRDSMDLVNVTVARDLLDF